MLCNSVPPPLALLIPSIRNPNLNSQKTSFLRFCFVTSKHQEIVRLSKKFWIFFSNFDFLGHPSKRIYLLCGLIADLRLNHNHFSYIFKMNCIVSFLLTNSNFIITSHNICWDKTTTIMTKSVVTLWANYGVFKEVLMIDNWFFEYYISCYKMLFGYSDAI